MPFHGERRALHLVPIQIKGKHIEERANLKRLPLGRSPTNPIHPPHMTPGLIQFTVKCQHHLHLPILSFSKKMNIPMDCLIQNLHIITHPSLFVSCNTIQLRVRLLQRFITTFRNKGIINLDILYFESFSEFQEAAFPPSLEMNSSRPLGGNPKHDKASFWHVLSISWT
jgi:hypothetical protein